MTTKDTNPKDALGVRKVSFHTLPWGPLFEAANAMLEGGCKYGTFNYRDAGCRHSVYLDSTVRHMADWYEGQDIDPDSGVHHIVKAIAGLIVLRDSMLCGNDVDDRPLRYPGGLNMAEFNGVADKILDKYPERKAPFTQRRRDEEDVDLSGIPESCTGKPFPPDVVAAEPIKAGQPVQYVAPIVTEKMDGARLTLTEMPVIGDGGIIPVDLPDDNQVKTSHQLHLEKMDAIDINQRLASDHPDREWYCDNSSCFVRGKPNVKGERNMFRCKDHYLMKDGETK